MSRVQSNVGGAPNTPLAEPFDPLDISIPITDASGAFWLRQGMINVGDGIVVVDSGSGVGGDFILVTYEPEKGDKRMGVTYGRDIAREFIRKVDPKADPALLDFLVVK